MLNDSKEFVKENQISSQNNIIINSQKDINISQETPKRNNKIPDITSLSQFDEFNLTENISSNKDENKKSDNSLSLSLSSQSTSQTISASITCSIYI